MSGDRVIVTEPNGVQRSRPMAAWGMSIGRGDDNDLVISYGTVSRKHAVVTAERGRYYITDLNSTAGTFLDNVKLEPNKATAWLPGHVLRVGDVAIQLEQATTTDARAETFHGALLSDTMQQGAVVKPEKDNRALVWIIVAVVVICILVGLGVAAYYFLV
jgi:pSer/pThr/pTyr-binding forkhead associated (FHA) protein